MVYQNNLSFLLFFFFLTLILLLLFLYLWKLLRYRKNKDYKSSNKYVDLGKHHEKCCLIDKHTCFPNGYCKKGIQKRCGIYSQTSCDKTLANCKRNYETVSYSSQLQKVKNMCSNSFADVVANRFAKRDGSLPGILVCYLSLFFSRSFSLSLSLSLSGHFFAY